MKKIWTVVLSGCLLLLGSQAWAQCDDSEVEIGLLGFHISDDGFEIGAEVFRSREWDRRRSRRPSRARRVRNFHRFSLADCPVYGESYEEWEDDESVQGIDLSGTFPGCAEACFEETVWMHIDRYGPPHDREEEYDCGEVERSATWFLDGMVLTVAYWDDGEERNLEVIERERFRRW